MTQGVRHSLHNVRHSLHDVRHSLQLTILNTIYITILKRAKVDEFLWGSDVWREFWLEGMGVFPSLLHS